MPSATTSTKRRGRSISTEPSPRREAILAAAIELFREQGFTNTTTDAIAARADMTKRTMYRHMGSKHQILVVLQERLMDDATSHQTSFDDEDVQPIERLRRFLVAHASLVARRSRDVRVLFEEMKYLAAKDRAELIERRDDFEASFRRTLVEGVDAGQLHVSDIAVAAYSILGALNGIRRWDDEVRNELGEDRLPEYVARLLLEGLLRIGEPSGKPVAISALAPGDPFADESTFLPSRDDWEINEVLTETARSAASLFSSQGYPRVATREIAEAAGMTKAALFYYVNRKEEILFRVMRPLLVELLEAHADLRRRALDGVELLRSAVEAECAILTENIDAMAVLVEDFKYLSEEHQAAIQAAEEMRLTYLEDAVIRAAAHTRQRVPHSRAAALVLVGMINELQRWFAPAGRLSVHQVSETIVGLFLDGVMGPASPPADRRER